MQGLPRFTPAELRTADALRAMLERVELELEGPPLISTAELEAVAAVDGVEVAIDRLRLSYERSGGHSPPYLLLDDWLARELGGLDTVGLEPHARGLVTELFVRWISISGAVGNGTRAIALAEQATRIALDDAARFRIQCLLCLAILRAREFEPPRTVRLAFATLDRARKLGIDEPATEWLELEIRMFAGCTEYLPVRRRLHHLEIAIRLAERFAIRGANEEIRAHAEVKRARAQESHARLAALKWLHRLVGFAPDS